MRNKKVNAIVQSALNQSPIAGGKSYGYDSVSNLQQVNFY